MYNNLLKNLKKILIIIIFLRKIVEQVFCRYVPFFGIFVKIRNNFFYESDKERSLFIQKMPLWYSFIELSWFMRILRVIMGLWLIFYVNKHVQEILNIMFSIPTEKIVNNILAEIFTYFVIIFFFCFTAIKFYLGIRYFSSLTRNSPITFASCAQWGFRRLCNLGFLAGLTGFGGTLIDLTAEKRGYVEPFDGYLQNATYKVTKHVTRKMASEPSKNLELLRGDEFIGAQYIKDYGQLNTLEVQKQHAEIYQSQQEALPIRKESAELTKNQQYKKE